MTPDPLKDAFERALEAILARVFACGQTPRLAIAYSGGLDSSVLLRLTHAFAHAQNLVLHAFHVHHGLSAEAGRWLQHCARECAGLDVPFEAIRVQVRAAGQGIEQAARIARYRALGKLCERHAIDLLLVAHHQDDQAETVLLQLLRGAGVAGLSGMEPANKAPGLLGQARTWIGRPLLAADRATLHDWADRHELSWVEDASNADPRYVRNRLRHTVMPHLERGFGGYQKRIARAAAHLREAQGLLDELAAADLQACAAGEGLDLEALRKLGQARRDNLLRHWFAQQGVRMPSTAWLAQMQDQIFLAGDDARVRVTHPDCEVWRYRGRILLAPRIDNALLAVAPVRFRWQGEDALRFPSFGGSLHFETAAMGLDPQWLREQVLTLRHRSGGERLKPAANRPSRDLKHHYQALGVPPWERRRLPLVFAHDCLLYAAGIGRHHADVPHAGDGIGLRWVADPAAACHSLLQRLE